MMRGWKTWAGGLLAIGLGTYLLLFVPDERELGVGLISMGFMAIGIGHKIEKMGGNNK